MSNIHSTALQLSEVEGVQFFTDNAGNAGLSQRGLAKLCGIPAGSAKRDIENIISKLPDAESDSKTAENFTLKGFEGDANFTKVYNSDLCVAVIEYAAMDLAKPTARETFRKFAKIGFTKWVQTITGYEPEVVGSAKATMSELEMVNQHIQLLQAKAEQIAYLSDKPGLAHKLAQAHSPLALPCEKLSFDEMCDLRGLARFETHVKRELSRKLANSVSNDIRAAVESKVIAVQREGKKPSYYTVKAYPSEALANFDNVVANYHR